MEQSRVVGAALGLVGVGLGAFGAHGLKGWLATLPDGADRLGWWQTGVQYQLWHALLIVVVSAWVPTSKAARASVWLAAAGCALFSGSLYAMTLSGMRALGAVTPLGGLCFLGAWLAVALSVRARQT